MIPPPAQRAMAERAGSNRDRGGRQSRDLRLAAQRGRRADRGSGSRLTRSHSPVSPRGSRRVEWCDRVRELSAGSDAELPVDLAQVVVDGVRAYEQARSDLRVGRAGGSKSRRLASCGVRSMTGPAARRGILFPVAASSEQARAAKPSAPIASNASWAARTCVRASIRRFCRRSHSP